MLHMFKSTSVAHSALVAEAAKQLDLKVRLSSLLQHLILHERGANSTFFSTVNPAPTHVACPIEIPTGQMLYDRAA